VAKDGLRPSLLPYVSQGLGLSASLASRRSVSGRSDIRPTAQRAFHLPVSSLSARRDGPPGNSAGSHPCAGGPARLCLRSLCSAGDFSPARASGLRWSAVEDRERSRTAVSCPACSACPEARRVYRGERRERGRTRQPGTPFAFVAAAPNPRSFEAGRAHALRCINVAPRSLALSGVEG